MVAAWPGSSSHAFESSSNMRKNSHSRQEKNRKGACSYVTHGEIPLSAWINRHVKCHLRHVQTQSHLPSLPSMTKECVCAFTRSWHCANGHLMHPSTQPTTLSPLYASAAKHMRVYRESMLCQIHTWTLASHGWAKCKHKEPHSQQHRSCQNSCCVESHLDK